MSLFTSRKIRPRRMKMGFKPPTASLKTARPNPARGQKTILQQPANAYSATRVTRGTTSRVMRTMNTTPKASGTVEAT